MASYSKTVKKKLIFKGDSGSVKVKKVKKPASDITVHMPPPVTASAEAEPEPGDEFKILSGTGRFTSSGTTVHGSGTEFMAQLSVGDAIIITHPTTMADETKIVRMVLSNVSIGISSPFSSDLISSTSFRYIKAPKDPNAVVEKNPKGSAFSEEAAFGTYASGGGEKITYRVKKQSAFGGYQIVTESANTKMSRQDLLDVRSKKKADRMCY